MDRRVIVAVVIVAIIVVAVPIYISFRRNGEEAPLNVENVGGKFNATISFFEGGYALIEYEDESGKHSDMYFEVDMRTGLDWIKASTAENATFLCWWDYGHMIKGYAERDVITRNPSEETIDSVADPSGITEFDPHERVVDVSTALTTSNFTEMMQIMEKYNATYIVICSDDLIKAPWIFRIAGLDETEYMTFQDSTTEFTEAGEETMIARLLDNRDVDFTLVYEDAEIKVYNVD